MSVTKDVEQWKGAPLILLDRIGDLFCGQSPTSSELNFDGIGWPYITGPEACEGNKIHVSKWVENPPRTVPDGCVFITVKGAGVGKLFKGISAAIGRDIYGYKPVAEVDFRYVVWALRSVIEEIKIKASGDIPGLSKADILDHLIPLAPLAEQKVIADKLDALLAQVDTLKARLDAIPAILKRFRQSVLSAAVTGKLTEDWRGKQKQLPRWEPVVIGDLLQDKPRNGYSPKSVDRETAVKSLSLSATTSGRFKAEHFKYIDESFSEDSHLWLRTGDILIQRANTLEYVGVSAIFDGPDRTFIYPDLMMKCRANTRTTPQYLHMLLSSIVVRQYYRDNATGTAGNMPKINQETVSSAPVELPPLPEQTEIVRRVNSLFAFADQIEVRAQEATARVKHLTQSILAKAFRGELTEEWRKAHPELVSGENSAEALLERIRATRASASTSASRGRRTHATTTSPAATTTPHLLAAESPKRRGRPRKAAP